MNRPRHVKLSKFHELTGYSSNAVHQKIAKGVWIEGIHYVKAPDGRLMVDLEAYDAWVRSESAGSNREKQA